MFGVTYKCRLSCSFVDAIKANDGTIHSKQFGEVAFKLIQHNEDKIYLISTGRAWRSALTLQRIQGEWTVAFNFIAMGIITFGFFILSALLLLAHGYLRPSFIVFPGFLVLLWTLNIADYYYFKKILMELS